MRRLILLLPLLILACRSDETTHSINPEFYFFNHSGVDIKMLTYRNQRFDDKTFFIPSEEGKNLLVIGFEESVPESKVPTGFPPFPYPVDYIVVIYNQQDTVIHSIETPKKNSLFNENSYEFVLLEGVPSYDFFFDEEDYENAKKR